MASDRENHCIALCALYHGAEINRAAFSGSVLSFSDSGSEIRFEPGANLFHGAGQIHGSVAFKCLDDAAYFAAQQWESRFFLLTAQFQIHFLRPVLPGPIRAEGTLRKRGTQSFVAEACLWDGRGKELAFGSGVFLRSSTELLTLEAYRRALP